jgi:hypothetical protein
VGNNKSLIDRDLQLKEYRNTMIDESLDEKKGAADVFDSNRIRNRQEEIDLIKIEIIRENEDKDQYTELLGENILAMMSGELLDDTCYSASFVSKVEHSFIGSVNSSSYSDE